MTKRRILLIVAMVSVLMLLFSITAFAANEPVSYKVQTENGVLERTTTVGKLFNVVSSGNSRIIKGINEKVDGFPAGKILEVHVPTGITEINIDTENSSVETIVFDQYCNTKVTSLVKFKGLKTISVFGNEATLTFGANCVPNGLESVIVTSPRASLIFSESAFKDVTSLKKLVLVPSTVNNSSSSYSFYASSFQNTGLEELILPSGAVTYTFSGSSAFSNCANLKYVYLGEAVSSIKSNMFVNCKALEMVYAEAVTEIADSAFKTSVGENSVLKVYNHSEKRTTVNSKAFEGRSAKGVILCALDLSTTSLSNCKYEIHFGIPHKYTPASDKPICYTSYVTDCPCGKVANVYYKLYQSSNTKGETVKLIAGPNPEIPHSYTSVYMLEYSEGIDKPGVAELKCGVCGTLEGVTRVMAPVVEFPGYSVSEFGDKAMMVCVRYNYDSLKKYEEFKGEELDFGLVMAAYIQLDGNNPLTNEGEAYSNSVYNLKMSSLGLYESTLKLNLKDTMLDTEFILAAYIKVGDKIVYIQGDGEKGKPESVSYSKLKK